jgi:hypothetical protein
MSQIAFVPFGRINLHIVQVEGVEYLASSTESVGGAVAIPYYQVVSRLPPTWRTDGLFQILENVIALLGAPHATNRPVPSDNHDSGGSADARRPVEG